MPEPSAGVMPPVDTWHPQVRRWVHTAWEQAGGHEGGRLALAQLVKALWAAGDPWSRAYRHLFAGAPAPTRAPTLALPDEEVFYAGEPDLVELMEEASRLGAGRIHPWAVLGLVAERTQRSAQQGSPGVHGVRVAPVEAVGEGTLVRVQRGLTVDEAMAWGGGRQVVAVIVDDRISSGAERYNTPYVEGHFHLLADDAWVLREPSNKAPFWVLEGVSPDAAGSLPDALRDVRRLVPGFVPWLPFRAGVRPDAVARIESLLKPLRTLPRLLLSTDPGANLRPDEADALVVALGAAAGGAEGSAVQPVLADRASDDDVLDHDALASSLAATLTHAHTALPFVVAIVGPSGSGRTDLLRRLEAHWRAIEPPEEGAAPGLRAVRVDARQAVAGLLAAIADAVDSSSPVAFSASEADFFEGGDPGSESPGRRGGPVARPAGPVTADPLREALGVLLPGAHTDAAPSARSSARAGLLLCALGGAGVLAAPPDWTAFVPAALLGVGVWLAARGLGASVFTEEVAVAPVTPAAPALPVRPASAEDRVRAALGSTRALLLVIDDLDRVPADRARQLLVELRGLLDGDALPPTAAAIGGSAATLHAACSTEHPLPTLVQVPLWLAPMRAKTASKALSAWTGLPAPRVAAPPPALRAVRGDGADLPEAVPIHVEAEDTGELGPADLEALIAFAPLMDPSPRAWKRLVNQARCLRPHLAPGTTAPTVAAWLVLAAADPELPARLRPRLSSGAAVVDLVRQHACEEVVAALADVPADAWPDPAALAAAADDVLRWTFVGPYASETVVEGRKVRKSA